MRGDGASGLPIVIAGALLSGCLWSPRAAAQGQPSSTLLIAEQSFDDSGNIGVLIGARNREGAPVALMTPTLAGEGGATKPAISRQKLADRAAEDPKWTPPIAIGIVYLWAAGGPRNILEGWEALFKHLPGKVAVYPTPYGQGLLPVVKQVTASRVANGELDYPRIDGDQIKLHDAIASNLEKLVEDRSPLKFLFIATDGRDVASARGSSAFASVGEDLRRKGIATAVVSFAPPADAEDAAGRLKDLVDAARARHVVAERPADVPALIEALAEQVTSIEHLSFGLPWSARLLGGRHVFRVQAMVDGKRARSPAFTLLIPRGSAPYVAGAVVLALLVGGGYAYLRMRPRRGPAARPVARGKARGARGRNEEPLAPDDDAEADRADERDGEDGVRGGARAAGRRVRGKAPGRLDSPRGRAPARGQAPGRALEPEKQQEPEAPQDAPPPRRPSPEQARTGVGEAGASGAPRMAGSRGEGGGAVRSAFAPEPAHLVSSPSLQSAPSGKAMSHAALAAIAPRDLPAASRLPVGTASSPPAPAPSPPASVVVDPSVPVEASGGIGDPGPWIDGALAVGLPIERAVVGLSRLIGPRTMAAIASRSSPIARSRPGMARLGAIAARAGSAEQTVRNKVLPLLAGVLRDRMAPRDAALLVRVRLDPSVWSALLRVSDAELTEALRTDPVAAQLPAAADQLRQVQSELRRIEPGVPVITWLVRVAGPGEHGELWSLSEGEVFLGDPAGVVPIGVTDPSITPRHARIIGQRGTYRVEPVEGRVELDGAPVTLPTRIHDGQALRLGATVLAVMQVRRGIPG